ncbi:MAG: glycosyltransferase family 1 protein [Microgenomates group bacterium]
MKRIGIDARLLFQTGVGTYLQNLLHEISLHPTPGMEFTIYCLAPDVEFVQKELPHAHIHVTTAMWHTMEEQTVFLADINKDKLDLMHFTYFGHPILYRSPFIATIHDVTPLLFKTGRASTKNALTYGIKHGTFAAVLKNQMVHSKAVITPTIIVKEQLVQLYGKALTDKIYPIHEGVSYRLEGATETKPTIPGPYLLYVGNFYPHKNVLTLVRAFAKSKSTYTLVLAGPRGYFLDSLLASCTPEEKAHILIKDKPTLGELVGLYKHAAGLIHPSRSEGFGLPLVEAMYFGIPILASHIPVFQELLGTSYYSFDPYEEESIKQAISRFEQAKVKNINTLKDDFSFSQMTAATMDLYKRYAA